MHRPFSLVIETSTPHASIALVGEDGAIEQRTFSSDRSHNSMLFAPLEELLADSREQIGLVLVGSGPGSYSGTRVGIAAAQGVAIALGCPAIAVPSILAVPSESCIFIGDARRGSYWTVEIHKLQLMDEPSLCDLEKLQDIVNMAITVDMPVVTFEDASRFPLRENSVSKISTEFPDATRLWNAWLAADENTRRAWSAAIPQPIYLKPPHITPAKRAPFA